MSGSRTKIPFKRLRAISGGYSLNKSLANSFNRSNKSTLIVAPLSSHTAKGIQGDPQSSQSISQHNAHSPRSSNKSTPAFPFPYSSPSHRASNPQTSSALSEVSPAHTPYALASPPH